MTPLSSASSPPPTSPSSLPLPLSFSLFGYYNSYSTLTLLFLVCPLFLSPSLFTSSNSLFEFLCVPILICLSLPLPLNSVISSGSGLKSSLNKEGESLSLLLYLIHHRSQRASLKLAVHLVQSLCADLPL